MMMQSMMPFMYQQQHQPEPSAHHEMSRKRQHSPDLATGKRADLGDCSSDSPPLDYPPQHMQQQQMMWMGADMVYPHMQQFNPMSLNWPPAGDPHMGMFFQQQQQLAMQEGGEEEEEEEEDDSPVCRAPLPPPAGSSSYNLAGVMPASLSVDPTAMFDTVPGRTTLLNATHKYKVTVGEIQRRISAPECLHASLVNGILRKGKAKDGGVELRKKMESFGMVLPSGRRKLAPTTAFTALCEEEAVSMSKDFQLLCEKEFHPSVIAQHLIMEGRRAGIHTAVRRHQLLAVRQFVDDMKVLLTSQSTHPAEFKYKQPIDSIVNHFSLITHGFGNNAAVGVISAVVLVVNEMLRCLEAEEEALMPPPQPQQQYQPMYPQFAPMYPLQMNM